MSDSDADEISRLQALRLRLYRLDPPRPTRNIRSALAFIKERRIVHSTGRSSLPMLAEAIAGRALRGSWMANPEVYRIYNVLKRIYQHPDVLSVPLVLGKDTFIHRSLGPALQRIAGDIGRRRETIAALPSLARRLLEEVERTGQVRMDRWCASTRMAREARLRLERALLVFSRDIHTEHGYHTAIVMPWASSKAAKTFGSPAKQLAQEDAVDKIVLAAIRSAVLAPEREVRRWLVFGQDRIDELLSRDLLVRIKSGRFTWITPQTAAPMHGGLRRAARGR